MVEITSQFASVKIFDARVADVRREVRGILQQQGFAISRQSKRGAIVGIKGAKWYELQRVAIEVRLRQTGKNCIANVEASPYMQFFAEQKIPFLSGDSLEVLIDTVAAKRNLKRREAGASTAVECREIHNGAHS